MLNQVVLVGRLTKNVKVEGEDKKYARITLAVPRSFKNENGLYDTDFINCTIYGEVARKTSEYCKKGDLLGLNGRLETVNKKLVFIADRVSFLSSKRD